MIDVVFLLLIFFLWTASFQIAEQKLPSHIATRDSSRGSTQQASEQVDFESVVVRVEWRNEEPTWAVNGRPVTSLEEVARTLVAVAAVKRDVPVIVDPARQVPLGHVIDVYDLTRNTGFEKVQFAADW